MRDSPPMPGPHASPAARRPGDPAGGAEAGRAALAILALGLAAFAWIRVASFTHEFGNNDVAGIAYEADTLLRGDLPYRDTVQFKPPGSFFVFAAVFGVLGRDLGAVHVVLSAWLLAGAWGVHRAARVLHGPGPAAALAAAVYLASAGRFDLNYSTWMAPACALAFASFAGGLRTGSFRAHLAGGAWSAVAFLFKHPAAVLAPLAFVLWLYARRRGEAGANGRAFAGWALGAAVAAAPLVLFYGARGALGDLLGGVFAWGEYRGHVAGAASATPPLAHLASLVAAQQFDLFPLATGLLVVTFAGAALRSRRGLPSDPLLPGVAFLLLSLAGGAMSGARFYEHYAIQYLPALALLAAHPSGVLGLARGEAGRAPARLAAAAALLLAAFQAYGVAADPGRTYDYRPPRLPDGSTAARRAGEHIRARTRPDETIYAWGWLAWPVYFWADRRAPLRNYREMGSVTTVNTNTAWSSSQAFSFSPGRAADELVAAFEERRPAYFVYSPYYVWQSGGGREPLDDFTAFRELLGRDYALEASYGNLRVYARKSPRR